MFGENKEEVNEVSKNDFKKIEKDLMSEVFRSEQEHTNDNKGPSEGMGSINFEAPKREFKKIPVPTELVKPTYTVINDFINGFRLKKVPPKHRERVKEILAPQEKEFEAVGGLFGYFFGYLDEKYGADIFNSPWIGPAMLAGAIGKVQLAKEQAFRSYLAVADSGGEK